METKTKEHFVTRVIPFSAVNAPTEHQLKPARMILLFALTAESRGAEKLITAEIAVQQVSDLLVRRNAESGNLYFAFHHQNRHNSFNESR